MRVPPVFFMLALFLFLWNFGPPPVSNALSATVDGMSATIGGLSRVVKIARGGDTNAFELMRAFVDLRS